MWPNLEIILAKTGNRRNIPYNLSTVAAETPERVGAHIGENGWFQLYTPSSKPQRERLLTRAKDSGFKVLVVTCDIPIPSRRERTKRAGLQTPPRITPRFIWQGLTHPAWTLATLRRGMPRLRTIEDTPDFKKMMSVEKFVPSQVSSNLSWETFKEIRDSWDGPLVLKGVMHPEDADKAIALGADGIQVSNHGARQFDAAPAAIDVLPEITRRVNGRAKIIFDSGIRSGLDIMKALNMGADFVFCGRAFLYGVGALDKYGGEHVYEILNGGLQNAMIQLGVETIPQLKEVKQFKI
jgi:L-lactate dehydrogenase (cytochrome)